MRSILGLLLPALLLSAVPASVAGQHVDLVHIKTSYLPHARLEFALDDTRYVTLGTLGTQRRP